MSKKKIWFKNFITVIEAIWSKKKKKNLIQKYYYGHRGHMVNKKKIWSDLIWSLKVLVLVGAERFVVDHQQHWSKNFLFFFFLVSMEPREMSRARVFFFFWLELVAHVFRFFFFVKPNKVFFICWSCFFWPLATIYVIQDHKIGQNETKKTNRVKKQWIYQMMVVVVKGHHHHNHNHQRRRTKYIIIIKCMNAGYP